MRFIGIIALIVGLASGAALAAGVKEKNKERWPQQYKMEWYESCVESAPYQSMIVKVMCVCMTEDTQDKFTWEQYSKLLDEGNIKKISEEIDKSFDKCRKMIEDKANESKTI